MTALRWCAGALVAVAVGGCSIDEEDEGCRSSASYRGERLLGLRLDGVRESALPPIGGTVRVRASICDGKAATYTFQTLRGVAPESAMI